MTTKTRVINDTDLKIDNNIKNRAIYKEEEEEKEWNEREIARKDQVRVFAECPYSENEGVLLRVYKQCQTDEM
jgi:hypothetical protein